MGRHKGDLGPIVTARKLVSETTLAQSVWRVSASIGTCYATYTHENRKITRIETGEQRRPVSPMQFNRFLPLAEMAIAKELALGQEQVAA